MSMHPFPETWIRLLESVGVLRFDRDEAAGPSVTQSGLNSV